MRRLEYRFNPDLDSYSYEMDYEPEDGLFLPLSMMVKIGWQVDRMSQTQDIRIGELNKEMLKKVGNL